MQMRKYVFQLLKSVYNFQGRPNSYPCPLFLLMPSEIKCIEIRNEEASNNK